MKHHQQFVPGSQELVLGFGIFPFPEAVTLKETGAVDVEVTSAEISEEPIPTSPSSQLHRTSQTQGLREMGDRPG